VERAARSRAPELDKKKYLVPSDLTGDSSYFIHALNIIHCPAKKELSIWI